MPANVQHRAFKKEQRQLWYLKCWAIPTILQYKWLRSREIMPQKMSRRAQTHYSKNEKTELLFCWSSSLPTNNIWKAFISSFLSFIASACASSFPGLETVSAERLPKAGSSFFFFFVGLIKSNTSAANFKYYTFFHAAYAWGSQGRGGRLQCETQLEQHNSQHQVHFARKVVAMTN